MSNHAVQQPSTAYTSPPSARILGDDDEERWARFAAIQSAAAQGPDRQTHDVMEGLLRECLQREPLSRMARSAWRSLGDFRHLGT